MIDVKKWSRIMRVVGGITGFVVAAAGVGAFIALPFDVPVFFWAIWQIIFGILCMLAEIRIKRMLRRFMFLSTFAGRGIFFIFVGTLCFPGAGAGFWYWIIGCACMANGFFTLGLVIFHRDFRVESTRMQQQDAANANTATGGGPSLGGIRGNTGNPELDAAISVGRTAQNLGISADDVARGGKAAYDMGARPEHLVQAAKYANAV